MPKASFQFDVNPTIEQAIDKTKILRHLPAGLLTNMKAGIHEATISFGTESYDFPRADFADKVFNENYSDNSSYSRTVYTLLRMDDGQAMSNPEQYEKYVKTTINAFIIQLDKELVKSTEHTNNITADVPTPPNPYLDTTTLEDILIYLSENMIGADLIVLAGTYEKFFLEDPAARNAILTDSINWHGAPMVFARDTEQTAFISGIVYSSSAVGVAEDTVPAIYKARSLVDNTYLTEITNTLVTNWQGYRGLLPTVATPNTLTYKNVDVIENTGHKLVTGRKFQSFTLTGKPGDSIEAADLTNNDYWDFSKAQITAVPSSYPDDVTSNIKITLAKPENNVNAKIIFKFMNNGVKIINDDGTLNIDTFSTKNEFIGLTTEDEIKEKIIYDINLSKDAKNYTFGKITDTIDPNFNTVQYITIEATPNTTA